MFTQKNRATNQLDGKEPSLYSPCGVAVTTSMQHYTSGFFCNCAINARVKFTLPPQVGRSKFPLINSILGVQQQKWLIFRNFRIIAWPWQSYLKNCLINFDETWKTASWGMFLNFLAEEVVLNFARSRKKVASSNLKRLLVLLCEKPLCSFE